MTAANLLQAAAASATAPTAAPVDSAIGKPNVVAMSFFVRYCAFRKVHPMSGGIAGVRLDRAADYLSLRKRTFGFELAPLPGALTLPAAERQLVHAPGLGEIHSSQLAH